jgi:outer membrane autotransporter protein
MIPAGVRSGQRTGEAPGRSRPLKKRRFLDGHPSEAGGVVVKSQASVAALIGTLAVVAASTSAIGGELRNQPGLRPFQQSMAEAIDVVCPKLVANAGTLNGTQTDLRLRCTEMKQTANALQGSGDTTFSLGLSNEQLNNALGSLSPEEAASQPRLSVDGGTNQARTIGARLRALRGGARGFSLGASRLEFPGTAIALADIAQAVASDARANGNSVDLGSRLGAFVNVRATFGDKDATTREQGFDFVSAGSTFGVDYRVTDNLILGVALSYTYARADINLDLGDVVSHSGGASVYGTYYVRDFYVDTHLGFEWNEYTTRRRIVFANIDRTATGTPSGQQYTANLGSGYDFRLGATTLTPYVRGEYVHIDIDSFTETGANGLNLFIEKQTTNSFQTALGARVSHSFSTPFGVIGPYLSVEWRHEFLNDSQSITAKYAVDPFNTFFVIPTDNPDRDYVALAVGVSAVFEKNISAFLNYETTLALRDVTHHAVVGGLRFEF